MTDKKEQSAFEKMRQINVSEQMEKKGGFNYLSWAWAVDVLLQHDPDAEWHYEEPTVFQDGTMMVHCVVDAFGKSRKMQLPVMNHKNEPVKNPNAFQINAAMQRCLVKAIALHGLGLYIYAGEDLPEAEKPQPLFDSAAARKRFCENTIKAMNACETVDQLNEIVETEHERLTAMRQGTEHDKLDAQEIGKQYKINKTRIESAAIMDSAMDDAAARDVPRYNGATVEDYQANVMAG